MSENHRTAQLLPILFDFAEVHPMFDKVKDTIFRPKVKDTAFFTIYTLISNRFQS